MRVVFFGTPAFAVPSLTRLIAEHDVVMVVTRPDQRQGRGQKVSASPVKALAERHGIPVSQPTKLGDTTWLEHVAAATPDLAVVAAYGRLLPQPLLDLPRKGFINVHASLLPRWRGAAPIHRAMLAGDADTGISIMRVVLALDAGPVLAERRTPIESADTSQTLDARLSQIGADLLIDTIARMASGAITATPQDESRATYAPRLERHESQIDWQRPAAEVDRRIRGLQAWPLAAGLLAGKRVQFLMSTVAGHDVHPNAPGTIVEATTQGLLVACAPGAVLITEVLPEGRRPMPVGAFVNGTPVEAGTAVGPLPMADPKS
jgi:methionyl-tRNA formyltransferase